jgi:hypothetical protein
MVLIKKVQANYHICPSSTPRQVKHYHGLKCLPGKPKVVSALANPFHVSTQKKTIPILLALILEKIESATYIIDTIKSTGLIIFVGGLRTYTLSPSSNGIKTVKAVASPQRIGFSFSSIKTDILQNKYDR